MMSPETRKDTEYSMIGSNVLCNETIDEVTDLVDADMLVAPGAATLFRQCCSLWQTSKAFDSVTLCGSLNDEDAPGGNWARLIAQCMERVPHARNARLYAEQIRNATLQTMLGQAFNDAASDNSSGEHDLNAIIGRLDARINQILERGTNETAMEFREILEELAEASEDDSPTLSTGFIDMDEKTAGGLRGGQLVILAARPSMGKSAFMSCIGRQVAEAGGSVMVFSLEQSRIECAQRLLASVAEIPLTTIQLGESKFTEDDQRRYLRAQTKLAKLPLAIDDRSNWTVPQIAAACRLRKRRFGLDLVIIDYLQLISHEDRRITNREQQVAQMSRGLKILAKDLNTPVICLSQLNRGVETRDSKTPRLSDLRESGAIEQDADQVWFLNRPKVWDPSEMSTSASVIVAKNRNGETGSVPLHWHGDTLTFKNSGDWHGYE